MAGNVPQREPAGRCCRRQNWRVVGGGAWHGLATSLATAALRQFGFVRARVAAQLARTLPTTNDRDERYLAGYVVVAAVLLCGA